MRRDRIDVSVREPASASPVLAIDVDYPSEQLVDRFTGANGEALDSEDLDVTIRSTGEQGVLALSDRVTGAFVLEGVVDVPRLLETLGSIRDAEDPDERRFRISVTDADGNSAEFEKRTLLVYNEDGSLSRTESLIPGGVEL